jgi:hypothetical protein
MVWAEQRPLATSDFAAGQREAQWPAGSGQGPLQPAAAENHVGSEDIRYQSRQGAAAMKLTSRASRRLAAGSALASSAILLPAPALASSAAPGTPGHPAGAGPAWLPAGRGELPLPGLGRCARRRGLHRAAVHGTAGGHRRWRRALALPHRYSHDRASDRQGRGVVRLARAALLPATAAPPGGFTADAASRNFWLPRRRIDRLDSATRSPGRAQGSLPASVSLGVQW